MEALLLSWILGIFLGTTGMFWAGLLPFALWYRRRRKMAVFLFLGMAWAGLWSPFLSASDLHALPTQGQVEIRDILQKGEKQYFLLSYRPEGHLRSRLFLSDQPAPEDAQLLTAPPAEGMAAPASSNAAKTPASLLGRRFSSLVTISPLAHPSLPDEFSAEAYYGAQGVSGSLTLRAAKSLPSANPWPAQLGAIRNVLKERARLLGEEAGDFLLRVLLGSRYAEPAALQEQLKPLGLSHLLAASGLHVMLLAQWGMSVMALLPFSRKVAVRLIVGLLLLYAMLIGFPASILRAIFFFGVTEAGRNRRRKTHRTRRWCSALALLLFFWPARILDTGTALSFLCALAIDWHNLRRGRKRISPFLGSIFLSFRITLLTYPVLASMQGSFTPITWIGNLFAIPCFSLLFAAGLLALVFGAVPFLGAGLTAVFQAGYALFGLLVTGLGKLPLFFWEGRFTHAALAWYLLLALWFFLWEGGWLARFAEQMRGDLLREIAYARRVVQTARFFFLWGMLHLALFMLLAPWAPATFTALDVGQGDALLYQQGATTILFDTGGRLDWKTQENTQAEALARALSDFGVTDLDAVFLSHADYDHIGNLEGLSARIPICHIITAPSDAPISLPLSGRFGLPQLHMASPEQSFLWKSPLPGTPKARVHVVQAGQWDAEDGNNASLCLLLDFGPTVLLMGDQEEDAAFLSYAFPPVTLLKVAHHGAASGTSSAFLRHVRPQRAVISVGADNRYGHPTPEVLERLAAEGVPVDRTDEGGHMRYVARPAVPDFVGEEEDAGGIVTGTEHLLGMDVKTARLAAGLWWEVEIYLVCFLFDRLQRLSPGVEVQRGALG